MHQRLLQHGMRLKSPTLNVIKSDQHQEDIAMKKNVGSVDRILRIIVGLTMMTLAAGEMIGPWGWLGAIILLTGVFSFCGIYTLLGIHTCQLKTDMQTDGSNSGL